MLLAGGFGGCEPVIHSGRMSEMTKETTASSLVVVLQ
jgi:hypothetical protein